MAVRESWGDLVGKGVGGRRVSAPKPYMMVLSQTVVTVDTTKPILTKIYSGSASSECCSRARNHLPCLAYRPAVVILASRSRT